MISTPPLATVADFKGGWGDISLGPRKNCQLKPPPKVKLGGGPYKYATMKFPWPKK